MSVCFGENVIPTRYTMNGKENYPYTYAATLSARLWRKVCENQVKVILFIVYTVNADMDALTAYIQSFADIEGVVIKLEKASSFGCVLQSQLSRLYAYKEEEIMDNDLIIISDVDVFVSNISILMPYKDDYNIYMPCYQYSIDQDQNFVMTLIGMTASNWRMILDDVEGSSEKYGIIHTLNSTISGIMNETGMDSWDTDQVGCP